jgi:hypothetical protein
MNSTKYFLIALSMLSSLSVAYAQQGKVAMGADAQNIDSACTQDAATASCGGEKVGTGLMKCLHAYKKANPSFQLSQSCHAAMKQMHMDRMAHKQGAAPTPAQQ